MQSMLNGYEVQPIDLLKKYIMSLHSIGQDINSRPLPQPQQSIREETTDSMTNAKRIAEIFKIIAYADGNALYHLSPQNFIEMHTKELQYLCTLEGSALWDATETMILHDAHQRMVHFDPNYPDFHKLEDAISEYDHYLAELKWDFEPWTYTADCLRFKWEAECEANNDRRPILDRTRL